MKYCKSIGILIFVGFVSGCSVAQERTKKLPSSYALPGTTTAVVGIAVDKKGIPLETVKEVVLKPGEKVILAGPDRFFIYFKNNKSPSGITRFESKSGVVTVTIPKDIFENPKFSEEYKKNKFIRFDYAINVNGKELDPPLIIKNND